MTHAVVSLRADRIVQGKIHQGGMCVMVVVAVVRRIAHFHLLALQFALNTFAIRGIANQGEYRSNPFNEL